MVRMVLCKRVNERTSAVYSLCLCLAGAIRLALCSTSTYCVWCVNVVRPMLVMGSVDGQESVRSNRVDCVSVELNFSNNVC